MEKQKQWLEKIRKEKNFTQEQVAKGAKIDRSYYSKIESGLTPSVKVAKNIASFLEFEWTVFFEINCAKTEQNSA